MNHPVNPDQDLIPVFEGEIGGVKTLMVDGRTLHQFLKSEQKFSDWMKVRLDDYGFVEHVDFLLHKVMRQNGQRGGHNRIDYSLTLDMAKELAMVERNEMGRLARRYFIQCESALRQKQLETHKETQVTDDLEDNQITILLEFMQSRASYWSIKKRDLIYQPGMDHDLSFSILEDIEFSTYEELYKQLRKKFPMAYQSIYFTDMRKFIHEWTPHFFRKKQTSKLGHAHV